MLKRILVPLDGSTRAERALPVAARIARAVGGSLVLYRVVPMPATYGAIYAGVPISQAIIDEDIAITEAYLDDLKHSKLLQGINVECAADVGGPAVLILEQAEERKADLIVICSHGRSNLGRWVLGSVAEHISRHAPVPVLVLTEHCKVPLDSPDSDRLMRVFVPLDGSHVAEAALEPAALLALALATPQPAVLHLTLVVDPFDAIVRQSMPESLVIDGARGYLMRMAERLQAEHPPLTVTWSVSVNADVTAGILHAAEQGADTEGTVPSDGCDLIAMATHGRSGLRRWALGSVAERVLHATKLPVMMVRPPQLHRNVAPEREARASTANGTTSVPTPAAIS